MEFEQKPYIEPKEQITIYPLKEVVDELNRIASTECISRNAVVNTFLETALEIFKKENYQDNHSTPWLLD